MDHIGARLLTLQPRRGAADFTALTPGGLQIVADAVVSSTRDGQGAIGPVLSTAETAKEKAYGVQAFRMELPHGRTFVPLAAHAETTQLGAAAIAPLTPSYCRDEE